MKKSDYPVMLNILMQYLTRKYYQQLRATIRLFNKVGFYVNKHRLVPMKATN